MKIPYKNLKALYIKKIGIDAKNKKLCGLDHCTGLCIGQKFGLIERFLVQSLERKYGIKNGKT